MSKKIVSILLVMMFIISTFTPVMAVESDYKNHWSKDTIEYWLEKGYINGYSSGIFKPDKEITRAEFIKIINTVFGYENTDGMFSITSLDFDDVKESDWYYDEILKATNAGYIQGVEKNKFMPNENITRETAAVILARVKQLSVKPEAITTFIDKNAVSDWAVGLVGACVEQGYLNGNNRKLNPKDNLKRAEAISMIDRAMSLIINKKDTVVENQRLQRLVISKEVGEGEVTLKNVTVVGELIINGGGQNSIIIDSSKIETVKVNKESGKIRLLTKGSTCINNTFLESGAILEQSNLNQSSFVNVKVAGNINKNHKVYIKANIDNLELDGKSDVQLDSGKIKILSTTKNSSGINISLSKNVLVANVIANSSVAFVGDGVIENALINENGVTFAKKPSNIKFADGVGLNTSTTGGGSSAPSKEDSKVLKVNITPNKLQATKGEHIKFTANVEGTGNFSKSVDWTIVSDSTSKISKDGVLLVANDEKIGSKIVIKAISKENSSIYATAEVEVVEEVINEVTRLFISPKQSNAVAGDQLQFTLQFEGTGQYLKEVKFELKSKDNSLITSSGLLKISKDAKVGEVLQIKVTSVSNPNAYDTATVKVVEKIDVPINNAVESVKIDGNKNLKLYRYQSEVIKAKVVGKNVAQKITWLVENENAATIVYDDYSKQNAVCVSYKAQEGSTFRVKAIATENKEKFDYIDIEVLRDNQISELKLYYGDLYDGEIYYGKIDEVNKEIKVKIPNGLNVSKLTAEMKISSLATAYPGNKNYSSHVYFGDFSKPINFVVTDAQGKVSNYKVIVEIDNTLKLNPKDEEVIIKEFVPLDSSISSQIYAYGTEESLLTLPSTIVGKSLLNNDIKVNIIRWKCTTKYISTPKEDATYIFNPIISSDISIKEGVVLPTITVVVKAEGSGTVQESDKVGSVEITSDKIISLYRGDFSIINAKVIGKEGYTPSQKIIWTIENDGKAVISNYETYDGKIEKTVKVNKDAIEGLNIIVKAASAANPEIYDLITVKVYNDNQISAFDLKLKGTYTTYEGIIDEENSTITVKKPKNIAYDEIEAEFYVKTDSTINPGERTSSYSTRCIDNVSDFTRPVTYKITNALGDVREYSLVIEESDSPDVPGGDGDSVKIGYFSKNLYRGEQKTIDATVLDETSQEIIWTVEGSGKASIVDTVDYSGNTKKAIEISEDAVEGSEIILKATSAVDSKKFATTKITVRYDNEIESFYIKERSDNSTDTGVYCLTNTAKNTVNVELAGSFDLDNLKTIISVKSDSTVSPGVKKYDGEFIDSTSSFKTPVVYTVADKKGNKRNYTFTVTAKPDEVILGFEPLSETAITVDNGTSESSVGYKLPYSVSYKIEADDDYFREYFTAKWKCVGVYDSKPTVDTDFVFRLELPKGFVLAEGVKLPEVIVTVKGSTLEPDPSDDKIIITEFKPLLSYDNSIKVKNGTKETELDLITNLQAKNTNYPDTYKYIWDITWECKLGYNATPDVETTYVFTPMLPKEYSLAAGVVLPTINVIVEGNGGVVPEPGDVEVDSVSVDKSVYRYNRNGKFSYYFPEIKVIGKDGKFPSQDVTCTIINGTGVIITNKEDYADGKTKPAVSILSDAQVGSIVTVKVTSVADNTKYKIFDILILDDNQIRNISVQTLDYEDFEGVIDDVNKTISIMLPKNTDISKLKVTMYVHNHASVNDEVDLFGRYSKSNVDFTNPVKYKITSEAGESIEYTVIIQFQD